MGRGCVTTREVTDLVTSTRVFATRLDPDEIADADVPEVLADLGRLVRIAEGMVTLLARRAAESEAHRRTGDRSSADVVANALGTSTTRARKTLEVSDRLREQAAVADAVRNGGLSGEQAHAVADATAADPAAEQDLLGAAASQTLSDLKRTCRDRRVAADADLAATRLRHHRMRTFRSWQESDGEWKAFMSGPADSGAQIEALLRGEHDDIFRVAHADGRREGDAAYRFDALLALLDRGATTRSAATDTTAQASEAEATGGVDRSGAADVDGPVAAVPPASAGRCTCGRQRSGRQTSVIITVPAAALRRGHTAAEEMCTIAGIGQVPLETVRAFIPDAHIAYVIADGRDVSVAHLGRQPSRHQRTALQARGYECAVPDCRATHLLEIDHVRDWAFSQQTVLEDLDWLCSTHHDQKTRRGYHLTGPPGRRTWHAPDGAPISRPPPDPESAPTTTDSSTCPVSDGGQISARAPSGPSPKRRHPSTPDQPGLFDDADPLSRPHPDLPALRLTEGQTVTVDSQGVLLATRSSGTGAGRRRRAMRRAGWTIGSSRPHQR